MKLSTTAQLRLSRLSSNDLKFDGKISLEIMDNVSGNVIVTALLTPDQFTDMLTTRAANVPATVYLTSTIGKVRLSESFYISLRPTETGVQLQEWIEHPSSEWFSTVEKLHEDGYTFSAIQRTNTGTRVIYEKYVDKDTQE